MGSAVKTGAVACVSVMSIGIGAECEDVVVVPDVEVVVDVVEVVLDVDVVVVEVGIEVEIGCWIGSSEVSFVTGLALGPGTRRPASFITNLLSAISFLWGRYSSAARMFGPAQYVGGVEFGTILTISRSKRNFFQILNLFPRSCPSPTNACCTRGS